MDAFVFIAVYVLLLAVPAAILAAVIAVLLRFCRLGRSNPTVLIVVASSIIPSAMVCYGLVRSWPWPWRQPDVLYDMIPPGPGLLMSAFPAWALSLTVSWLILRRRKIIRD